MVSRQPAPKVIKVADLDAFIFDLDGVMTETATVHGAAWKGMFDDYLLERAAREGETFRPFDIRQDYLQYVDGKPRYDGVRDFLASRGIELPAGDVDDPPERETVAGLGNRKNERFKEHLEMHGVDAFTSSVEFVRQLLAHGLKAALISASKNCRPVLKAAGIAGLFEVVVDGVDSARLGLAGKPAPDIFLEAARNLGADATRTAIVEDAVSGVAAGARGHFALVIGVDRTGNAEALRASGAHLVVADLAELTLEGSG